MSRPSRIPRSLRYAVVCGLVSFLLLTPQQASAVPAGFVTPSRAIALLNQQRERNGIPGGLTNNTQLSKGCSEFENEYVPAPNQYPHEELKTQPGYTPLGEEAAVSSDLAYSDPRPTWGPEYDPWWHPLLTGSQVVNTANGITLDSTIAPLHLSDLFNPASTSAWFGETLRTGPVASDCMGTGGQRTFSEPEFFSLPGPDGTDLPAYQVALEIPWTPQMVIGIPEEQATGPNFVLWPEDTDAVAQSATLSDDAGKAFPVRLVLPTMPSPANGDPQFAFAKTVGVLSNGASFAIPTEPLLPSTSFTLTISWASPTTGSTYTQTIPFRTGPQTMVGTSLPFRISFHSPRVVLKQSATQLRRHLTLVVKPCRLIPDPVDACEPTKRVLYSTHLVARGPTLTAVIPNIASFGEVSIVITGQGFVVGDTRYQAINGGVCYPQPCSD